jgi:hypothetical protein
MESSRIARLPDLRISGRLKNRLTGTNAYKYTKEILIMEANHQIIQDIMVDILAGMDQAQLVGKYGISPKTVERLYRTMIERGCL